MKYCAILLFLLGYCAFSFSQTPTYSQRFETSRKNLPLEILNNHQHFFHLLRYNKAAHDLFIERRAKPGGEMLVFTPLKMDEVNASWFDYQNLDYLFFEHKKHLYFVFEKVLNNRISLFMKVIDTAGRASGFIELAVNERETSTKDFGLEFKTTADNNLLIVTSQVYQSHTSKKVMLYDIEKRQFIWTRKLAPETAASGYSSSYETNSQHDLYYARVKSKVVSTQRRYMNHMQVDLPVYFYDEVNLEGLLNTNPVSLQIQPLLSNVTAFSGLQIFADTSKVSVHAWYAVSKDDTNTSKIFILSEAFGAYLQQRIYQHTFALPDSIEKQLTFFDGGDYDHPSKKEYYMEKSLATAKSQWLSVSRTEQDSYKEQVLWSTDRQSGQLQQSVIIPRKVYGFGKKTRFRHSSDFVKFFSGNNPCFVVAEAPSNFEKQTQPFNFKRYKAENNLWKANIVMYKLKEDGGFEKTLLHANESYDLIPLPYTSKVNSDAIFYLTNGKYEKFLILPLAP
jgi:hypothetical protein